MDAITLSVKGVDDRLYAGDYFPCGAALDNEREVMYAFRDEQKTFLVYGNELSKEELRQFNKIITVTIKHL